MQELVKAIEQAGALPWLLLGFAMLAYGRTGLQRRQPVRGQRTRRASSPYPGFSSLTPFPTGDRSIDAAAQLRAVENAIYNAQPVLRYQEGLVFAATQAAVREARMNWHVFAQVSLGEILICPDKAGFNAINAKRVDLLLADEQFKPIAAIEYQGTGHHLGKAAARDAIKKEALRKAGIDFVEITHDDGPDDVRQAIGRLAWKLRNPVERSMRRIVGT